MKPADHFTDEHRHPSELDSRQLAAVGAVSAAALMVFGGLLAAVLQAGRNLSAICGV